MLRDFAGGVLILVLVTGAAPNPHAADRAEITAGESAFGGAFVSGDVATLDRLLDDSFVGVDTTGAYYDKAGALADARQGPHLVEDRVHDLKIAFFGNTAVAQALETEIGPEPERKPLTRVFTDTWVKGPKGWRIVAASDVDPGLPMAPALAAEADRIRAIRAASNAAIRAHDMAALLPAFAEDAVFAWSNGSSSSGRAAMQAFFARDFADPAFGAYIRTPAHVIVSQNGLRAAEHGTWTALKTGTRYGGDYSAQWYKGPQGWQIRGEVYIKLFCTGPLCTP